MELTRVRQPLRWFKLWLILGWLLVAAVIYLSLTPKPVLIDMEQGDKLGHMLGYMAMMLWFAQIYGRRLHHWWGLGFVVLGVALEYAQGWSGYRGFEYFDMAADAAGVLAGWLLGGTAAAQLLGGLERRLWK